MGLGGRGRILKAKWRWISSMLHAEMITNLEDNPDNLKQVGPNKEARFYRKSPMEAAALAAFTVNVPLVSEGGCR
jgi:hypothetical protein